MNANELKNIKVGKGILYRVQHEKTFTLRDIEKAFRDIEKVFKIKRKETNPAAVRGNVC